VSLSQLARHALLNSTVAAQSPRAAERPARRGAPCGAALPRRTAGQGCRALQAAVRWSTSAATGSSSGGGASTAASRGSRRSGSSAAPRRMWKMPARGGAASCVLGRSVA